MSDKTLHELGIEEPMAGALARVSEAARLPLVDALPDGFDINTLLTFLPDVKLKKVVQAAADAALAVPVEGRDGIREAEARMAEVAGLVKRTRDLFAEPVSLANQLHKRLTGLREDFVTSGEQAVLTVKARIVAEMRRLDQEAERERREAQARADAEARAAAQAQAKDAAERGAPQAFVRELEHHAASAVAASVAPKAPSPLAQSALAPNWKARLVGTPDDAEPNPGIDEMSEAQRQQVLAVLAAVVAGTVPLVAVAGLNWSYLNARAKSEKTTFGMPQLEAYDAGSLRAKGRRR